MDHHIIVANRWEETCIWELTSYHVHIVGNDFFHFGPCLVEVARRIVQGYPMFNKVTVYNESINFIFSLLDVFHHIFDQFGRGIFAVKPKIFLAVSQEMGADVYHQRLLV
jgi:hypothetical protein